MGGGIVDSSYDFEKKTLVHMDEGGYVWIYHQVE